MSSIGYALGSVPHRNLLDILFAQNDIPEDFSVWRNPQVPNQNLTKSQGRALVRRLADGYVSNGVINPQKKDKDKVITVTENQVIGFPNILAAIAAGGVVATCPWQASSRELLFRINILRPTAIIASKTTQALVTATLALSQHKFKIIIQDSENMTVEDGHGVSYISDREWSWSTDWDEQIATTPAVLVFSSGTTGTPKGVCISQRNIISMIFQLRHLFKQNRQHGQTLKMLGVLDNAHVAGMFINVFCGLGVGIENILASATDIDLILQLLELYSINVFLTVPTVLARMLDHPRFHKSLLKSLRFVCTGAAKTPETIQQAFSKELSPGTFCQMAWGMTELTFLATMHEPGVEGPWSSIGKPLAGNSIEIRDDRGMLLSAGQTGELWASGPTVTSGYYLADIKDHEAKQGDWLRTGDVGTVDTQGYVYVTGRNKDLIKYNGAQIAPQELEDVVRKHEAISEVGIVGMELADGNELPTAFVVLRRGISATIVKEIAETVNKEVSPYKRLRGGVHVIETIPKNPMGKILYNELRDLAKKLAVLRSRQAKL